MYGLINKAMKAMVTEQLGEGVWGELCTRAKVSTEDFVTMQQYPDSDTYQLVAALSDMTGSPSKELLVEFGKYWIRFASSSEGYGEMMQLSGNSFIQFLENLDLMHERIALSFANLQQPSFKVERKASFLLVHYYSQREGLAPFVEGLLYGLADYFDERVSLRLAHSREQGADHDTFEIVMEKS